MKKKIIVIFLSLFLIVTIVSYIIISPDDDDDVNDNPPDENDKTNIFKSTWDTTQTGVSNNTAVMLPLESTGIYNFYVDWGDGTNDKITTYDQSEKTHGYSTSGNYTIEINGTCKGWRFHYGGDCEKILLITQWGNLSFGNSGDYFNGCVNLECTATDSPNLEGTMNLSNMFYDCTVFNGDIGTWDVSSVTTMYCMFYECAAFNQDIGAWDVSSVTTMYCMFYDCVSFNQDIGAWDVSNVTTMYCMFFDCWDFNQDIGAWNVSNVIDMSYMFYDCVVFNQDIGAWDVSKVTTIYRMFYNADAFNCNGDDLEDWDNNWLDPVRTEAFGGTCTFTVSWYTGT